VRRKIKLERRKNETEKKRARERREERSKMK
jgi:hypothetical protein